MTITYNCFPQISTWVANSSYYVGLMVSPTSGAGANNAYICTTAGTSATSGTGPSGTGSSITDGSCVFAYVAHIDYATLPAYFTAIQATPPTDAHVVQVWQTIPNNSISVSTVGWINYTGTTNYPIVITPAPGNGFRETLAADPTKALKFSNTYGVSFFNSSGTAGTYIKTAPTGTGSVTWDGFQFLSSSTTNAGVILDVGSGTVRNCVIDGYGGSAGAQGALVSVGSDGHMYNCLVIDRSNSGTGPRAALTVAARSKIDNCSLVKSNTNSPPCVYATTATTTADRAVFTNCLFSNYSNASTLFTYAASVVPVAVSYSHFTVASTGLVFTDLGNNLYSQTVASTFVDPTTNWRLLTTSTAVDAGYTDNAVVTASDDIIKTARLGNWDMGAYEVPPNAISAVTRKPTSSVTGTSTAPPSTTGSIGGSVTTLNPTGLPTGVTLTNSNRTLTSVSNSSTALVRSTISLGAGTYYFEFNPNWAHNSNSAVGIATSTAVASDVATGITAKAVSISNAIAGAWIYINGTNTVALGSTVTDGTNTIGVAIDTVNSKIWAKFVLVPGMYWNNNSSADPATGVGGQAFSLTGPLNIAATVAATPGEYSTLNFGTSFQAAAPAGFTPVSSGLALTRKPAASLTGLSVNAAPITGTISSTTRKPAISLTGAITSPNTATISATTRKPFTFIGALNPAAVIQATTKKPRTGMQAIYADAARPFVPVVRNLADDKYAQALLALLPQGRFWPKTANSNLTSTIQLFTPALDRLESRGANLLVDSFPGTTTELLPEWESTLGLPDTCWGDSLTLDKRRAQVRSKLVSLGGESISAINAYAGKLGFTTTIKEFSSFKADANQADQPLTDETYNNSWQLFAPTVGAWKFQADKNSADEALGGFGNDVLRCEISAIAPSHTNVNFVVATRNMLTQTEHWGFPWILNNTNLSNGFTDPNGGSTAYLLTANSNATAIYGMSQSLAGLAIGSRYTFSVYAKQYNTADLYMNIRVVDSTNSVNRYQLWGRLKTPVVYTTGGSAGVTGQVNVSLGTDYLWGRYIVSGLVASPTTTVQINITNAPSGTTVAGQLNQGFYIWHPQFELGDLPGTGYVPSVDY